MNVTLPTPVFLRFAAGGGEPQKNGESRITHSAATPQIRNPKQARSDEGSGILISVLASQTESSVVWSLTCNGNQRRFHGQNRNQNT